MTMKAQLASLLAATALWGVTPAMALPPLDDFEIEIRGEAQGWLNAPPTTTLAGLTRRKPAKRWAAEGYGDYLGEDLAKQAKKIALERSPGCQAVWPETAE